VNVLLNFLVLKIGLRGNAVVGGLTWSPICLPVALLPSSNLGQLVETQVHAAPVKLQHGRISKWYLESYNHIHKQNSTSLDASIQHRYYTIAAHSTKR